MGVGKLKMWNANRGYGFIADEAGGPDMFLHIGELKTAGIDPDTLEVRFVPGREIVPLSSSAVGRYHCPRFQVLVRLVMGGGNDRSQVVDQGA